MHRNRECGNAVAGVSDVEHVAVSTSFTSATALLCASARQQAAQACPFLAPYLARGVSHVVLVENSDGIALSGHVGALSHQLSAGFHQGLCVILANLVLGGAGQGNVILGGSVPGLLALKVLACKQRCAVRSSLVLSCCISGTAAGLHGHEVCMIMS